MKIELFARRAMLGGLKHYFRIRAGNGEVVAQSEGYSRKIDARGTAELLRNGIASAEIVEVAR